MSTARLLVPLSVSLLFGCSSVTDELDEAAAMSEKVFGIPSDEIRDLATGYGGCIATDQITVDGKLVGYMYREHPSFPADSGWRIFSGEESQDYVDDAGNSSIYDCNTVANYDPAIIPFLASPVGSAFGRVGDTFVAEELIEP